MSIKDLIVHLDEETASEARLDAAIALALAFGARLVGLALVAQPFVPLVELPPERHFREQREARADTLLATAAARAGRAGVTFEMRRETAPADRLPELFVRHARHADLVVVGRSNPGPDAEGVETPKLQETAFLGTGRPTLIVPTGAGQMPPARMLVAWDGSREAARAVHDALPLLGSSRAGLARRCRPAGPSGPGRAGAWGRHGGPPRPARGGGRGQFRGERQAQHGRGAARARRRDGLPAPW